MAMVRKKEGDKYLEALRELITTGGGNRQCFDCGQKGPTYVNMTIGSFVCTRCSGVLRGITPPHRVKSISMATFTQDEIDFLKAHGNDVCAKTWLGLWDPKRAVHQDQRELMIDKYERKRYYLEPASPLKSLTNATNLKTNTASNNTTATTTSSASASSTNNSNSLNSSNSKTQIQLTPPTSQRTTANGLHKTSSTAISRPQHSVPSTQNGFSTSLSSHTTDAFGLHNGLNSSVGSMSTGALSDTSSCASANGFGAEADFVADFGSADIFNATVASSPASSVGSSTTNNGYAKIQPMKASSAAHQQFMNGHNSSIQNGNLSNGNTENFADFDHAPIYNAAVEEPPNYQFVRKNAIRKKSTSSISGSIIRRNERQLKDILEMDNNEMNNNIGTEANTDYITFNEDDVFTETRSRNTNNGNKSGGYSNLFDDFDTLLTLDDNNSKNVKENDYANVGLVNGQQQLANGTKFTPLALAAHATAMAVLGNQSHFNNQSITTNGNQWDVWSSLRENQTMATNSSTITPTATTWFPSNNHLIQNPYDVTQQLQQQQNQQQLYATLAGNFHINQPTLQQQYFPSSSYATQTLTHTATTTTTSFETAKPTTLATTSSFYSSSTLSSSTTTSSSYQLPPTTTTATTIATTSMFDTNSINSTNPFRMHLDVNDNLTNFNNNTISSYENDINLNNINHNTTTKTTPTNDNYKNNNNIFNTDFNLNLNDFNFVQNSILSYDLNIFSTAATSSSTATNPFITTATTNLTTTTTTTTSPIHNSNKDNFNPNLNLQISKNYDINFKNPFLNSLKHKSYDSTTTTSISSSTCNTNTTTSTATTSFVITAQTNPFKQLSFNENSQQNFQLHNDNHEIIKNNYNNNYDSPKHSDVVASNNYYYTPPTPPTSPPCEIKNFHNFYNSNQNSNSNFNSNTFYCSYTNEIENANLKSENNYKQTENNNQNVNHNNDNNNSWRLPINNNNNNKNSTTNGFINNNNNQNNINNNNNNNSSAPAEDRYAALKDLDEQLRESKAVAAQAASIVTANVVDSGFGNPNIANGTVNPFAPTHQHPQTAVVNPFQNASNNPTQNATQQLFGQMTLIPNGIAAANGFLNAQKTHTANTGFFNYTASGFTNANTPQIQQQQQQQHPAAASLLYPTSIPTAGPNGCGFGFGTLQQQIASTGTGLTTNTFNNPFAATGALNSNNPFL